MKKIIAVLILGLVGFSLHAEEVKAFDQCSGTYKTYTSEMNKKPAKIKRPVKIEESKLTSLNYVNKLGKPLIKERSKNEFYAYSVDGKVFMCKLKYTKRNGTVKIGVVTVDGETYARVVVRIPGLLKITYNLHDIKCSFSGRIAAALSEGSIENESKIVKGLLNDVVKYVCGEGGSYSD